jgi:acyl-coenzyme A synthetase/AMP-(fatty) acid ligase
MKLPLLQSADPERPVLWAHGSVLSARELMQKVAGVAAALPSDVRHLINLCERRDDFLIAFCAALVRGHTNLLPSSRAAGVVDEVAALHAGSYRCDDDFVSRALSRTQSAPPASAPASSLGGDCAQDSAAGLAADAGDLCAFELPSEHVVVKAFTSGSTGTPQAHLKFWRSFAGSTAQNAVRIRECLAPVYGTARPWIVATVPPQHMYGLETSIILPLLSDMAVHAARPLFPADIAAALAEVPEPRVLVTTPVHMRAIAASGQRFPRTALVLSATAPLDVDLAQSIERQLDTTVLEMFGSTETCVIASRRTSSEREWHLYPDVTLVPDADGASVNAPWFVAPMRLQDLIELRPAERFTIYGRNADMIEVAGKRASLADLTRRLLAIPGVQDAVVFQPDAAASGIVRRVAALVVAPALTPDVITDQLARSVDPAFIPRPLVIVPSLPRNEVGKLPRAQLIAALHPEK